MIEKLYKGDVEQYIKELESLYTQKQFCVTNFLYFANAVQYKLLEQNVKDMEYKKALLSSDFLLPDGIALQIWAYFAQNPKKRLHNLNWTDLTPKILEYFSKNYTVHLYIYSLYDEKIWKSQEWLHKATNKLKNEYDIDAVYSYQSHYNQRWYDYPWEMMEEKIHVSDNVCNIFLNCTGSPFQEKWIEKNKEWFVRNHMMVLNVWWFLDFYSWFEKRAPKRVVKTRVLETFWRIITNPKKNLKKFLAMFGVIGLIVRTGFTTNKKKWK